MVLPTMRGCHMITDESGKITPSGDVDLRTVICRTNDGVYIPEETKSSEHLKMLAEEIADKR